MDYGSEPEWFMNIVVCIYMCVCVCVCVCVCKLRGIDRRDRDRHIGEREVGRIE